MYQLGKGYPTSFQSGSSWHSGKLRGKSKGSVGEKKTSHLNYAVILSLLRSKIISKPFHAALHKTLNSIVNTQDFSFFTLKIYLFFKSSLFMSNAVPASSVCIYGLFRHT